MDAQNASSYGALGDALLNLGRHEEAFAVYDRMAELAPGVASYSRIAHAREILGRPGATASGVRTELDSAHFELDRDRDVRKALALARVAHDRAPSLEVEDVLAWALYKNGRYEGAERHANRANRFGTNDPLVLFHQGMIQRCLGNTAVAKELFADALAANRHFSLRCAPLAEKLSG